MARRTRLLISINKEAIIVRKALFHFVNSSKNMADQMIAIEVLKKTASQIRNETRKVSTRAVN